MDGFLRLLAAQIHQLLVFFNDVAVNGDGSQLIVIGAPPHLKVNAAIAVFFHFLFRGLVHIDRAFKMAVGNFAVVQLDFVVNPFVVILVGFDAEEGQREQNRAGVEKFEFAELPDLARRPRQQRS